MLPQTFIISLIGLCAFIIHRRQTLQFFFFPLPGYKWKSSFRMNSDVQRRSSAQPCSFCFKGTGSGHTSPLSASRSMHSCRMWDEYILVVFKPVSFSCVLVHYHLSSQMQPKSEMLINIHNKFSIFKFQANGQSSPYLTFRFRGEKGQIFLLKIKHNTSAKSCLEIKTKKKKKKKTLSITH